MWLNEEARIAQVANINQLPGTNGFTSPPKDAVMNTSSFLRVELSTLIGEKSLTLVGLEPATFRLQASTLTSRPLVPPRDLHCFSHILIKLFINIPSLWMFVSPINATESLHDSLTASTKLPSTDFYYCFSMEKC